MKGRSFGRLCAGKGRADMRPSQSGMVSIMVTMIMMLVISLIVLGFAQVSRREQRQTLDRQLSSQAFFAAESAVNDARDVVSAALANGRPLSEVDKDKCGPTTEYPATPTLDSTNNVSYTCLLVTTQLDNVQAAVTAGGDATTLPLEVDPASQISTLRLKWSATSNPGPTNTDIQNLCAASVPANGSLPQNSAATWRCPYGVVRIDIVPTASLDRAAVTASQRTYVLYPTSSASGAQVNFATDPSGVIRGMDCKDTGCDIDVTNLAGSSYALRVSSQYVSGRAVIQGLDSAGKPLQLKNAQVQIDATGKAQKVLRRIQVRLALNNLSASPGYALESGSSVCKRFSVASNNFTIPVFDKAQDDKNPMCRSVSSGCSLQHDVFLALDSSDSMNNQPWMGGDTRRERLRQIADAFAQKVGGGVNNRVSIISFADSVNTFIPFTSDVAALTNFIDTMPVKPGTKYVPPLLKGQDVFTTTGRPGADKILVFISDGEDYGNAAAVYTLADTMKASGISLYTIGVNPFDAKLTELENMASPGGYTSAVDVAKLDATMNSIADAVNCN